MRYDNYEFRASALGKIISKSGKLTQTNLTYIQECFIGDIHNVQKDITSRYFEKGIYCEEDGISLLNETLYKGRLLVKNKERKRNGWIHGEADSISPDGVVHDIKNAFDRFTFGKANLSWDYEWQIKGYCYLWGLTKGRLFYCLNNMPEHMLVEEERKAFYKGNFLTYESPEYLQVCEGLRSFHNYDNMELWERFKTWDVSFTNDDENIIKKSVTAARKVMNEMYDEYLDNINRNKRLMGLNPDILLAHHDHEVNAAKEAEKL